MQRKRAGYLKKKDTISSDDTNTRMNEVLKAINTIEYGSVQVHIQNGLIVQIDCLNKKRLS
jgi:hypothetical protein